MSVIIEGTGNEVRTDNTANNDLIVFLDANEASLNFTPFEFDAILSAFLAFPVVVRR